MSQFTTDLIVSPINDTEWKLIKGFEYHIGQYPSNDIIIVPPGFITNFASVPRIFWSIIPPYGKYGKASVIHDYCYKTACYNRKRCDDIFYEGMKVLNVLPWKRFVMYWCVRIFAYYSWQKKRRQDAK